MSDARLILTWGLPGAGKTTFARQLAADRGAVRLTKDEWMWALGSTPWDGPTQQKVEHESLALEVSAEYIRNWPVFVLELDGQLLGFGGFLKVATKVFLNDLFVDPPWIGTGVGALLWNHAIDVARERSWASFDIESDPYAEGFYLKYGAVRIGDIRSSATAGFFRYFDTRSIESVDQDGKKGIVCVDMSAAPNH